MSQPVLQAHSITKTFPSGEGHVTALKEASFAVEEGERIAITGPSGSGKTTLLALCAGLDTPSDGRITLMGSDLGAMSEDERAYMRSRFVGFVFQNFQLLPSLTALENVMTPVELAGGKGARKKALTLLDRVGLARRTSHYPSHLSGGEQQRVALARAFVNSPKILFADEPTGNLDEENAHRMEDLLLGMNKEKNTTLILVTHNMALARKTGRVLPMRGGRIAERHHTGAIDDPSS